VSAHRPKAEGIGTDIPEAAVPGRRTPAFTAESMPPALAKDHRTTVWAELVVEEGTVLFVLSRHRRAVGTAWRAARGLRGRAEAAVSEHRCRLYCRRPDHKRRPTPEPAAGPSRQRPRSGLTRHHS